jgi:hypothetical protein
LYWASSPDAKLNWIARNAGDETVCGLSAPARIVNVAGTRTLVAPPAGAEDLVEVVELVADVVELVAAGAELVLLVAVDALAADVVLDGVVLEMTLTLLEL